MSNEKHETVADIVREMRKEAVDRSADASCTMECAILRHYSDRIEAAYRRLALPTPDQWTEIARQAGEISALKSGNARLIREAQRRTKYTWTCRDGREIAVEDMSDEHLANAIAVLLRMIDVPEHRQELAKPKVSEDGK